MEVYRWCAQRRPRRDELRWSGGASKDSCCLGLRFSLAGAARSGCLFSASSQGSTYSPPPRLAVLPPGVSLGRLEGEGELRRSCWRRCDRRMCDGLRCFFWLNVRPSALASCTARLMAVLVRLAASSGSISLLEWEPGVLGALCGVGRSGERVGAPVRTSDRVSQKRDD